MIVYIYEKCSTCKQALIFLKRHGAKFTVKEIAITPPSVAELQQMLKYHDGNLKKLFNTSGLLYKEMQLSEKLNEMTENESLLLLSQHGMLVKRPFLLAETFGLTGFNESIWSQRLIF